MIAQLLTEKSWFRAGGLGLLLAVVACYSYAPALEQTFRRWAHDPQYTHGFLVPFFAGYLLWRRRDRLAAQQFRPSWWGLVAVGTGMGLRLLGAYLYLDWLVGLSLLPTLAGLGLLASGGPLLRWSWPAIAFLLFMVPLPYRLHAILGGPLQHLAAVASTYALQTLGFPALNEGNIVLIDQTRIGVVEACSGLSMLLTFFALSTAVVLVIERPLLDRLVLLASALPVAVACNLVRITATGLLHELVGGQVADLVFHDLAGWLMMPLAVTILLGELWLLSRLFVEVPVDAPVPLPPSSGGRKNGTPNRRKPKRQPLASAPTVLPR